MDINKLIEDYKTDRQAVSKFAAKHGVTVQAVYWRLNRVGFVRRKGGDATKGVMAREKNPNYRQWQIG